MRLDIKKKTITGSALILCLIMLVTSCGSQGVAFVEPKDTGVQTESKSFEIDITLEGGSGKAGIESPVTIEGEEGAYRATLVWTSKNYDYMVVDGEKYLNENPGGYSTFTIPVKTLDEPLEVIGDTTAMSKPHEISYVIYWGKKEEKKDEASASSVEGFSDVSIPGLEKTGEEEISYAGHFKISRYGDYSLLSIKDDGNYLIVPEGLEVPDTGDAPVKIIKQPVTKAYLASSSVMDLCRQCGCLDRIRLTSLPKDDWYIEEAADALSDGTMLYAGKYSAPDYELILSENCDLAIENTMIYHRPEVKEKLEELGIPVMVEMSSREEHPLGRLEWIRVYGLIFDCYEASCDFYNAQKAEIEPVMQMGKTGLKAAYFYVSSSGMINVRRKGDYISEMIELAGGSYVPENAGDDESRSTMNMQMEDFYAGAGDADVLIYNGTIGGQIESRDDLIGKNPLFADFEAVKNGSLYCTTEDFFQESTGTAAFIKDLHHVLSKDGEELVYLRKVGDK